jgi:hypothetical protein
MRPPAIQALFFAAALIFSLAAPQAAAQCGDMNGDGFLDTQDFLRFTLAISGPGVTPADPNSLLGDLDADGDVDLADLQSYAELYSDNYQTYAGMPPDCAPLPNVITLPKCVELGAPPPQIHVFVPPQLIGGTLEVRIYRENDDANFPASWVYRETRTLSGEPMQMFSIGGNPFTTPGMYAAVAQLTRPGYGVVGRSGAPLGVRPPGFPTISGELCTFEPLVLDALQLKFAAQASVQNQMPMTLNLGTRTFEVILQSNNEILSPEIQLANPDVQLYRGFVVGDPTRDVRISFGGDVETFTGIMIDSPAPGRALYVDAAVTQDPYLPPNQYVAYIAEHTATPLRPHTEPPPAGQGDTPPMPGPRASHIHVNVYYDWNDTAKSRFDILNKVDSVFNNRLGKRVYSNTDTRLNTDAYRDPTSFIDDFKADPNSNTTGANLAWLLTNNSANISYGDTLGTAYWSQNTYVGTESAYCWVKAAGTSTKCKQLVSCHEMSHNLGASNTTSSHRGDRTRRHTHGWWIFSYTHDHYSIMRSGFITNDEERMDDRWLDADGTTVKAAVDGFSN